MVLEIDAPAAPVRWVQDVCGLLAETIHQVRTRRLDTKVASTVGYLASVLVRALEVGELEERLAAIDGAVRGGSVGGSPSSFHHNLPTATKPQEEAQ